MSLPKSPGGPANGVPPKSASLALTLESARPALVSLLSLFNRFYQPNIDLTEPRLHNDLQLSKAIEIGLPLLWIAVLSGRIDASLAASTGVENSEQVLKYLLAGADVVMTTSALLRNGPHYVKELLAGTVSWLSARDVGSVGQIRGLLSQRNFRNPDSFGRANYIKILQGYKYRSEMGNLMPDRTRGAS
jgi:dihydroorotate dehydrogenase (fumarate)